MKYVAVIDTDDFEDFGFFEDGNGKYLHAIDEGSVDGEWICLYFKEAPKPMEISLHGEHGYRDTTTTKYIKEGYNQALRDCEVLEE